MGYFLHIMFSFLFACKTFLLWKKTKKNLTSLTLKSSKNSEIHIASCFILYILIFQIFNMSKLTFRDYFNEIVSLRKKKMSKLTMKNSMVFLCFLFIFLSVASLSLQQLQNNDMVGLMAFKSSSIQKDPKGYLANWSSMSSSSLCLWNGVICSPDNQVTTLNFTNAGLTGNLHIEDIKALKNLKHIYFRGNSFSGDLSHNITLPCNFETIDFSSNNFSDPISDVFLSSCDHLISLNLSRNSIPHGNFLFGASLQILDLSHNLLTGELPSNFVAADAESPVSLIFLDLSRNNLSGNFSIFNLGKCNNLTVLNLSHNHLHGTGFSDSLKNCQHLQILDLSNNWLQFHIPRELGNLKSLQKLSLANNGFSGEIPGELNQTCRTLQELDLSRNYLTGGFPLSFISCSSLQTLNLGNNILSVNFLDTVVSNLSSLKHLYVPFNNITGSIPLSLSDSIQLLTLDLSSNGFTGNFPSGLCSSSSSLQKILFRGNFLSGTLPSELGNCKNLRTLDLSFNNFSGSIPLGIWALPNLSDLVMWANSLSGEIPESICSNGGGNLEKLILNNNFLTGTIPQSLTSCTNLRWLSLASNRLTGKMPTEIGKLNNLAILQLGNNSLTGEIPAELGKCRSLIWIELNNNRFNGYIPPELADQSGLITNSFFDGNVEVAFVKTKEDGNCKGLQGLVMIEGIRTQRLNDFLMMLSCSSLRIYPSVSSYSFSNDGSLLYLDLSYNFLTGHIPDSIGSITYLQALDLEHNKLTGTIPNRLGDLRKIEVLDISDNDLEGIIPTSFGTLSFLIVLDVSNNNLTGSIPSAGQLITLPSSRYVNNSGLCGTPLPPCVSAAKDPPPHLNLPENKKHSNMDEGFVVSLLVGFVVGFWGFWFVFLLKTSWRYSTFSFMDKMTKKFCLF